MHLRAGRSVHHKGSPDENCVFSEMYLECPCGLVVASFFLVCVIRVFRVLSVRLCSCSWVGCMEMALRCVEQFLESEEEAAIGEF